MASSPPVEVIVQSLEKVKGPDKDGWYTALCVFHNDREHPNLRVNEHGFVCFACGHKGDLTALAAKLGIAETPSSLADKIIAEYDYRDADGHLVFQVVRLFPKDFRQRRANGTGGWIWKTTGMKPLLYRLPELLAADPSDLVFIAEGEKDVDRLRSLGLVATCNSGGAGKWRQEHSGGTSGPTAGGARRQR